MIEDLGSSATIAIDTPLFIYLIEEHPAYLPIVRPVFMAIDTGIVNAVTSALTLMETLVHPYRARQTALAEKYEALLARSRGLRLVDITRDICRAAAQLRASCGVKTADALQLATALMAQCPVFLTNDRNLPPVSGIHILQVKDYL